MARSPEYKAFKRSYSFLRNTLTANDVAPVASSNGLLTKTERQAALHSRYEDCEKNDKLLEAIEKRILANPENFHKFVQLLEDELEEFLDAAQKLRGMYCPSHVHNVPTTSSYQPHDVCLFVFVIASAYSYLPGNVWQSKACHRSSLHNQASTPSPFQWSVTYAASKCSTLQSVQTGGWE